MTPNAPDESRGGSGTPRAPAAWQRGAADRQGADPPGLDRGAALTVIDLPEGFFPDETRTIKARDLRTAAMLPLRALVAWICPDRLSLALARAACGRLYRRRPGRYGYFEQIFGQFLPDGSEPGKRAERVIEAAALYHLERLQLLRYHRPGSWRPVIEVAGKERLERALARGKGAILWVTYSTFSDMIAKIALRELGYDVWHLSRHTHGHFSTTRFGLRFLNPIRISLECRHLAGRVVIDPADPKAALARLERLLADNQVVSITVGAGAQRITLAPFGPGTLPLAGGAPSLAVKSGAALLPLFAERRADGSFLVTIEPPLEAPPEGSRAQRIAALIEGECALLWRHFERLPTQHHNDSLHSVMRQLEAAGKGDRASGGG